MKSQVVYERDARLAAERKFEQAKFELLRAYKAELKQLEQMWLDKETRFQDRIQVISNENVATERDLRAHFDQILKTVRGESDSKVRELEDEVFTLKKQLNDATASNQMAEMDARIADEEHRKRSRGQVLDEVQNLKLKLLSQKESEVKAV